jgi:hypothetical protein
MRCLTRASMPSLEALQTLVRSLAFYTTATRRMPSKKPLLYEQWSNLDLTPCFYH